MLHYTRSTTWISTASKKKPWSHIWLLENKNEFISGKIMKRHHHHHHRQYNPKNDKHCIYTYKTLRQQRTQNVQCHVQGTSSHIGEVVSTNVSGRRPKLNGRRQSRRRTKESRRESSTSMSANCQRRSLGCGDQTDVRPPVRARRCRRSGFE